MHFLGTKLRTTSSAIGIKPMALSSHADYAPWASGTRTIRADRRVARLAARAGRRANACPEIATTSFVGYIEYAGSPSNAGWPRGEGSIPVPLPPPAKSYNLLSY